MPQRTTGRFQFGLGIAIGSQYKIIQVHDWYISFFRDSLYCSSSCELGMKSFGILLTSTREWGPKWRQSRSYHNLTKSSTNFTIYISFLTNSSLTTGYRIAKSVIASEGQHGIKMAAITADSIPKSTWERSMCTVWLEMLLWENLDVSWTIARYYVNGFEEGGATLLFLSSGAAPGVRHDCTIGMLAKNRLQECQVFVTMPETRPRPSEIFN